VAALEQKVANLELKLNSLLAVLTVEGNGQKAKLKAATLEIESTGDLRIKSAKAIECESQQKTILKTDGELKLQGASALLKASAVAKLEGATFVCKADTTGMIEANVVELNGVATTSIKAPVVKFNNGSQKVARAGDLVASGIIANGCGSVFA
jgi:hypothetical protein